MTAEEAVAKFSLEWNLSENETDALYDLIEARERAARVEALRGALPGLRRIIERWEQSTREQEDYPGEGDRIAAFGIEMHDWLDARAKGEEG